jgi:hypothetical protein
VTDTLQPHGTRVAGYLSITLFRNGNFLKTSISNRREDLHKCSNYICAAITFVIVVESRIATRCGNAQKGGMKTLGK